MAIDFKNITDPNDFELLCRDVLQAKGAKILSDPSVGPDQGKDVLIEVISEDNLGSKETNIYVVQCKHFAKSGNSVKEKDVGDFRSACDKHGANGYLLITSTMPSTTVQANFESATKKGDYKCIIWDKKILESSIEELENSVEIIKRYNLKTDFENLSGFVKKLLDSETKLPFEFFKSVEEEGLGGQIYKKLAGASPEPKHEFIGYFWTENKINESEYEAIKKQYSLSELHIITTEENKTDFSMSLHEFYLHIQSHKDYWYQSAIVKIIPFTQINPTVIYMFNSIITPLPYAIQEPLMSFLSSLIDLECKNITVDRNHMLLTSELCKAIAKHNIQDLKPKIFELLGLVPVMRKRNLNDTETLLYIDNMAYNLIVAIIDLEEKKPELTQEMILLFDSIDDKSFKMYLLPYLKKFKIKNFDDELQRIKAVSGSSQLTPPYNGIHYTSRGISIVKNMAPYTFEKAINEYFDIKDDSLTIHYDFS